MAQAVGKSIQPLKAMARVMAPATEEDWTTTVRMAPKPMNIRVERMPWPVSEVMNVRISGFSFMSGTESLRNMRPRKRRPKPMKNSPVSRSLALRAKSRGRARPMTGRAMAEMLNLKPK